MCEVFQQESESIRRFLSNRVIFQEPILAAIQSYYKKSYGAENQITKNTTHNMAICLKDMGKCSEALDN